MRDSILDFVPCPHYGAGWLALRNSTLCALQSISEQEGRLERMNMEAGSFEVQSKLKPFATPKSSILHSTIFPTTIGRTTRRLETDYGVQHSCVTLQKQRLRNLSS